MSKLYYEAPSDEVFQNMKDSALKVWEKYKDEPGAYYQEKVSYVNRIENLADNFMVLFAMFDIHNQTECVSYLSPEAKQALKDRLIDGGNDEWYLSMVGIN